MFTCVKNWHVPPRTSGIQTRQIADIIVQKPKRRKEDQQSDDTKRKRPGLDGIQSTLYNPVETPLHEIDLPSLLCPYFNSLEWKNRPQWSQIWSPGTDLPLVETKFGLVPKGSLLSYHLADNQSTNGDIVLNGGNPSTPPFALPDLTNYVTEFLPLNHDVQGKYNSLFVTDEQSIEYEQLTKEQSNNPEWKKLRQNRLTASNFKRVCSRRGNFESLSVDLHKVGNVQTAAMKYGLEMEPIAAEQYAKTFGRNLFKVGFVINPTCSYLGCSPDRRVYDPDETSNPFRLLEIKCSQAVTISQIPQL